MTRLTINFILAFCNELKTEIEEERSGKGIWEKVDKAYITRTMLSGIYNVLIYEGYTKKHLDNFFFFDDEPNKHKEWTDQAYKFYYTKLKNSSRVVEKFFNEDPAGIKLRKEIDKLSEKFD